MNYTEQNFEEHIEENLLSSGYKSRPHADYDRNLCLIPKDLLEFIKTTQPDEYRNLETQYGDQTEDRICRRIAEQIQKYGTLRVLRKGVADRGEHLNLVFFKPVSGMNPKHWELYKQNIFTVVRQLHYSVRNENSIDMVIFVNGIPIITMELKNSLTGQFVGQAIRQYKTDRDPKEQLLEFKRCLVHFAVGNEKVYMTTELKKGSSRFFPFNKETYNPPNQNGHRSSYLWEDILQPDTILDLIHNYICILENSTKYYDPQKGLHEKKNDVLIFPRYHQLRCVRRIVEAVGKEGTGYNYLVHHSAGSGKSNSIAWLAHRLACYFRSKQDNERLFDSVIVVTDRRLLDKQLQDTISQFEQVKGVVKPITKDSQELRRSLERGSDIIITTLQKFPFISEHMSKLKGKRFAVIIDEAHSSQTGDSAKHLKMTLSVNIESAEDEDKIEYEYDDKVKDEILARGHQSHISYFAFTATPKNKTLEIFGRKDSEGQFHAFDIYTMRQAIEEGFILDVLSNYTTYKRYFRLVKTINADKEYPKRKALRLILNHADLQPHAIEMKSRIMLDHFANEASSVIGGESRAMIVTRSRLHAVRFYLSIKKLMKEMGLPYMPLVAFSGTVEDPDSGAEYTENSMNELGGKISIRDALKTPQYRILVVANKFQTGFDEPKLSTMYVDKRLGGVQAVQTLSRLNRIYPEKETFVLDFVNEIDDIKEAFQDYYQKVILTEESDPNKLYDIRDEILDYGFFKMVEVEEYASIFFDDKKKNEKLQPILDKVVEKWREEEDELKREDFRTQIQRYTRLYAFLSQIITFKELEFEKYYVFLKSLDRKLPKRQSVLPLEVLESIDLTSFREQMKFRGKIALERKGSELEPVSSDVNKQAQEEKDLLSNIVRALNDSFGTALSEEEVEDINNHIIKKWQTSGELWAILDNENNSEDSKIRKSNEVVDSLITDFFYQKTTLYKKLLNPRMNNALKRSLYENKYKRKN